ncbi:MAG: 2Fe-2S iron-sulfur cluster-binding protein [Chloroflexi bacterium]|nr:2Fe-2S iron-sulfur cluster-binding protein [Chloroflexota bacterium]
MTIIETAGTTTVTLRIWRTDNHFVEHTVAVPAGSYVIDAIERVYAQPGTGLVWRHACHHASCGSCGLRINGVEKLPCVTLLSDYPAGKPITLMPLAHFPRIADLVVDFVPFFDHLRAVGMPIVRRDETAPVLDNKHDLRFENCIECGLCVSACPAMANPRFLGPAALAAAERLMEESRGADLAHLLQLVDQTNGIWSCRSSYQCSAVCPTGVDPAGAIIRLRKKT